MNGPSELQPSEEFQSNALTVEQAIANLQGEDLGLRVYAAWWLGRFRVSEPEAITVLIAALEDEDDRTEEGGYPLRRNAARALGKLGDRNAVSALIRALQCRDFYVREAAAQALESLGDKAAIPALVNLLQEKDESIATPDDQPAQPFDAILEALGTLGAIEAMPEIDPFLTHPVPRIQFAAARALYQLSPTPDTAKPYGDRLIAALSTSELQLRRTVLADLGAIGYLDAADAIAETLAENSLKLISLEGVLTHQRSSEDPRSLTSGARHVMTLMDQLL